MKYEDFEEIVIKILKRDISSNKDQKDAISAPLNESQFIVAGPGSGKTTVIVLKILKFIFVDGIKPQSIVATTFTKKAASELHSRILQWGDEIKNHTISKLIDESLEENINNTESIKKIQDIDLNQIRTGTTDSIGDELLRVHREAGKNLAILIEEFVSESAMTSAGLQVDNRYLDKDLQKFLGKLKGQKEVKNLSQMSKELLKLKNTLIQNSIDMEEVFRNESSPGSDLAYEIIKDYYCALKSKNSLDFTMLDELFLEKLDTEQFKLFLDEIKVILIDEYQDTNPLQEKIYFKIAKSAIKNNGNITVVGDDDQSLYRFRGATIDLFTNYKSRAKKSLDINVREINLSTNYRSTKQIINLCNHFVELDSNYQSARVNEKPSITCPSLEDKTLPILGLFRNNVEILSHDLTRLLSSLINEKEVKCKVLDVLKSEKNQLISVEKDIEKITLKLDDENGSLSDISLLTYSPKEFYKGNSQLPLYLRKQLEKKGIDVFNPRGKELYEIEEVGIFCGLMLLCIDPDSKVQKSIKNLPGLPKKNMNKWRRYAKDYIDQSPEPTQPISLKEFVEHWQLRKSSNSKPWPGSVRLMDLAYKLVRWIEYLQDDVEGIVYLEAITKTINQTGYFNEFESSIIFNRGFKYEKLSIEKLIWNIFVPLANGGVAIEEKLLETLPSNRLNIMSIHQSKGLEFPLVIVDVGSKFDKNKVKTSKLRFPKTAKTGLLQEWINKYSDFEINRNEVDSCFDDLTRLYFVAFSRAEEVLILIGLNTGIRGYIENGKHEKIPNVALAWTRNEEYIGFEEIYMI